MSTASISLDHQWANHTCGGAESQKHDIGLGGEGYCTPLDGDVIFQTPVPFLLRLGVSPLWLSPHIPYLQGLCITALEDVSLCIHIRDRCFNVSRPSDFYMSV